MCGDESSVQIGIASYRAAISDASKLRLYTRQDRLGMLSTRPGTTGDEFPLPMRVHPAKHDAGTTRSYCPASATRGDWHHLICRDASSIALPGICESRRRSHNTRRRVVKRRRKRVQKTKQNTREMIQRRGWDAPVTQQDAPRK